MVGDSSRQTWQADGTESRGSIREEPMAMRKREAALAVPGDTR